MALINCPECETQVSDKADKCPNCAFPLKDEVNVKSEGCFLQTMNLGCMVIVSIIIFIIFLIFFGAIFESTF